MITLTARINLLDSSQGTITSGSITNSKSNISADFGAILGSKKQGSNPFIFGASILGNYDTFDNSVNYYIGGLGANANGVFETPYTITINGENISGMTIEFDTYNKQYPNSIVVDSATISDDDPVYTIPLATANTHTIIIDNWNTPNYPLRIQGIYIDFEIIVDNRNMINIDRTIMDRSDIEKPSFGIIANSGNIEFNDLGGEIKDYIEQQLLKSNLSVEIFVKNTSIQNKVEQIGKFSTNKWNYDNENRKVSVSLSDDLLDWQNILIEKYKNKLYITMKQYFDYLVSKTPQKYVFETLDSGTLNILNNTISNYIYVESNSLWSQYQKLCEVCGLYIYKNNQNKVVVKYEFGD